MAVTIQTRRDDSVDWTSANPVLALGEIGIETDTDKAKYGDGFTAWNDLEYWDLGADGGQLPAGTNGQVLRYGASWEATSDLVVDDAGNVGIGTTAPNYRLAVRTSNLSSIAEFRNIDAGAVNPGITIEADADKATIGTVYSGGTVDLAFKTSLTERMRIDSAGNVGIGNTGPSELLDVGNTGRGDGVLVAFRANGFTTRLSHTGNDALLYTGGGIATLGFGTNSTERMRIDTSGNLLVGKTAASYTTAGLLVESTGRVSISRDAVSPVIINMNVGTATNTNMLFQRNGAPDGAVQTNGGTPIFVAGASDARLKANVQGLRPELANVLAMRPVTFTLTETDVQGEGFIAQEVQEVWPDLVSDRGDGYLTVAGLGVVETRLIKAIQEQQEQIDELRALIGEQ